MASSRDRDLARDFGIANDFQSTKRVRFGPWYGDLQDHEARRSCRLLRDVVTEFGAQGLELDAALLAWGSDYLRIRGGELGGRWSSERASKYKRDAVPVRGPHQLRLNAYRVLMTRGREATVAFVPPAPAWDETYAYLCAAGFAVL